MVVYDLEIRGTGEFWLWVKNTVTGNLRLAMSVIEIDSGVVVSVSLPYIDAMICDNVNKYAEEVYNVDTWEPYGKDMYSRMVTPKEDGDRVLLNLGLTALEAFERYMEGF